MSTVAKTGNRGMTVFGRDPSGSIRTRHFAGMADILARGSQTVLPPTPHPAGVMYRWTSTATLLGTPIAALPIIGLDIADSLAAALAPWRTIPEPVPAPARVRLQPCVPSENERERQHRYAVTILSRELPALASMASNTGRNQAAFRLVCRVGRWAHHEIIARDQLVADVIRACEANGLVREDGRRAVLATIASGLARSAADALPELGARQDERHNGAEWINRGHGLDNSLTYGSIINSALPHLDIERKPMPHEPVPLVRPVPAADPYPVDGLGSQLAAVVRALNDVVQSPLAMCANSVLATVTLAAQGQINVELPIGAGSTRPVSGFFITVGRSGERKSASDEQIGKALKSREAELRQIHDAEMKVWRNEHDAWEAARKAILAGKQDKVAKEVDLRALGDEPAKPLAPIIIMEEPTVEGLAKLLMAGQPSVGVFSTEGGQFVGGHAMSDDAKLRSAAALSRLWDGEPWKRVRSSDGAHIIADKRLAMHLMVQPDGAAQLVNDPVLRDQGLVSRMLVTFPETTMGTRLHHDPAPASLIELARFNTRMTTALALPYPLREKSRNDLAPRTLRLSPEARPCWIAFGDHIERMIGPGGELEPIRGFAAKMAEHAARTAAAMAWWSNHDANEIDAETLSNAIRLVEHYADEALRLWQASVVPADIADAQRLLDWLNERWSESHVSIADICRLGPNAVRVAQRARQLVKVLEDHHWLVKASGPVPIGGQKRREAWQIMGRV